MVLQEAFSKQRRFLIALGIIMFAYFASGISLDTISILGNTFKVSRPEYIPTALWVCWVYSSIRYYQLFRDLADAGPSQAFQRNLDRIALSRAAKQAPEKLKTTMLSGRAEGTYKLSFDQKVVIERNAQFRRVRMDVVAVLSSSSISVQKNYEISVPVGTRLDKLRALMSTTVHTRYFTEYALPVVLALAPIFTSVAVRFSR